MRVLKPVTASLAITIALFCTPIARGEETASPGAGGQATSNGVPKRLYLASHGKAGSAGDDRALLWGPWVPETGDTFEPRNAGLEYTTAALERPVQVSGEISLELYAASDTRDAGFTAAIEDVQPDGNVVRLASTPAGTAAPSSRVSGKVQLYRVDLGTIAHAFLPGHRIRVEVSPNAADAAPNGAGSRVLHGVGHPSALVLHVTD